MISRSLDGKKQNQNGRNYREKIVALADMLLGYNYCGEALVSRFGYITIVVE